MGTKHRLAGLLASILDVLPKGPLLDLFSGMCAVGSALNDQRPVWTNDRELFPVLVARTLLTATASPPSSSDIQATLQGHIDRNTSALADRFRTWLDAEDRCLSTGQLADLNRLNSMLTYTATDQRLDRQRARLARQPFTFPYRLATITYPGSYFGVRQCFEIDSIRYGIDAARAAGTISREQRLWLIVALGRVLVRVNNSTGHFAEYLKPTERNLIRVLAKRRRSVWTEFLQAISSLHPVGTPSWRLANRCFHSEALSLLSRLARGTHWPRTIYADPPFSRAQYSRYYHVLNVIAAYDYPSVSSNGRYPANRFQTPFAHAAAVERALTTLVERTSRFGCALLLSYPDNGLYHERGGCLLALMKRYYSTVTVLFADTPRHSTLGGSPGRCAVTVRERLYLGLP
jgi:adenine-specific DNA-methyltransferase